MQCCTCSNGRTSLRTSCLWYCVNCDASFFLDIFLSIQMVMHIYSLVLLLSALLVCGVSVCLPPPKTHPLTSTLCVCVCVCVCVWYTYMWVCVWPFNGSVKSNCIHWQKEKRKKSHILFMCILLLRLKYVSIDDQSFWCLMWVVVVTVYPTTILHTHTRTHMHVHTHTCLLYTSPSPRDGV